MKPWARPPMSRQKWIAEGAVVVLVWVTACLGAAIAIVELTDGTTQAVGLTVVAFLAAPLIEVPAIFTERGYEEYREQWTRDNWPAAEGERTRPG